MNTHAPVHIESVNNCKVVISKPITVVTVIGNDGLLVFTRLDTCTPVPTWYFVYQLYVYASLFLCISVTTLNNKEVYVHFLADLIAHTQVRKCTPSCTEQPLM